MHLEGAIPHEALWELVKKYGGDAEVADLAALQAKFEYRDFPHFIETWVWKNQFLREYEDFTFIAEHVARDLAAQNIEYVEAFYSPLDFARHGLSVAGLTAALREGLEQVPGISVSLIVDLIRDFGPERAHRTLDEVTEIAKAAGVIGIGIGGSEQEFPPEPFAPVYREARHRGFRTTAHAGEAAGAESIWGAVRELGVDRIGHGTRADEDPELLHYLIAERIPVEVCPTSNVRTGVVASLADHPVARFLRAGMQVSVNTDDPKMFGNSLAGEYRALETEHGLTRAEIRDVVLAGVDTSWLDDEPKKKLRARFEAHPAWGDR